MLYQQQHLDSPQFILNQQTHVISEHCNFLEERYLSIYFLETGCCFFFSLKWTLNWLVPMESITWKIEPKFNKFWVTIERKWVVNNVKSKYSGKNKFNTPWYSVFRKKYSKSLNFDRFEQTLRYLNLLFPLCLIPWLFESINNLKKKTKTTTGKSMEFEKEEQCLCWKNKAC